MRKMHRMQNRLLKIMGGAMYARILATRQQLLYHAHLQPGTYPPQWHVSQTGLSIIYEILAQALHGNSDTLLSLWRIWRQTRPTSLPRTNLWFGFR